MDAEKFIEYGISVIPIRYKDKRPMVKWEKYKKRLPTVSELGYWQLNDMLKNYGVVMGWHDIVVLDFDDMEEYTKWQLWTTKNSVAQWVGQTAYRVVTSRGVHVYVAMAGWKRNKKIGKIDIKGNGYVLGEGSTHPTGEIYTALTPDFVIPRIENLEMVLPASMLVTQVLKKTEPAPADFSDYDPWKAASNPPAKVSSNSVKDIKNHYKIEDFVSRVLTTSDDARWYLARCPLHDDNKPSMWVDTDKQICGCFAGCTDKPLDVISLYAMINGVSNSRAIEELAKSLS